MGASDAGGMAEDWRGRSRLGKGKGAGMGPSNAGGLAEDLRGYKLAGKGKGNGGRGGAWREESIKSVEYSIESRIEGGQGQRRSRRGRE